MKYSSYVTERKLGYKIVVSLNMPRFHYAGLVAYETTDIVQKLTFSQEHLCNLGTVLGNTLSNTLCCLGRPPECGAFKRGTIFSQKIPMD